MLHHLIILILPNMGYYLRNLDHLILILIIIKIPLFNTLNNASKMTVSVYTSSVLNSWTNILNNPFYTKNCMSGFYPCLVAFDNAQVA